MRNRYHLFCFLAILCWSTIELSTKIMGQHVSPWTITAWRFLIGGLVILPFALFQNNQTKTTIKPGNLLLMIFLGILNVCISMLLLQISIWYGKASISAILVSTNPVFVSILAFLILKERLTQNQVIGLLIAFLGIFFLIAGERNIASGKYANLPLSILLGLSAAFTFGLYTVLAKKLIIKHGNLITNSVSFIGGSITLFVINTVTGKPMLIPLTGLNVWIMLWLGLVISGVAYLLFFESTKKLGANVASMYFFLKPVIASFLAFLLLKERLTGMQVIAIGFIILGLGFSRIPLQHKKTSG
jgi:drug/metabolite transporter (DMT)-like permease